MRPEVAIAQLQALRDEAHEQPVQVPGPAHTAWKAKTDALMERSLGSGSATLTSFRDLNYTIGVWTGSPGEDLRDAQYFAAKTLEAAALIDAAIFELELTVDSEATDSAVFDPELWQHVRHSVEEERWEQVASAATIFLEDRVRRWTANPTDSQGKKLHSSALFANAFKGDGPLALGTQKNETDSWLKLCLGVVGALGNVDRHGIQDRTDSRLYAYGVLGVVSLILTQVRFQHGP